MANQKDVIDDFLEIIRSQSESRWGKDFTVKDLVYHLIENGIIPPKSS